MPSVDRLLCWFVFLCVQGSFFICSNLMRIKTERIFFYKYRSCVHESAGTHPFNVRVLFLSLTMCYWEIVVLLRARENILLIDRTMLIGYEKCSHIIKLEKEHIATDILIKALLIGAHERAIANKWLSNKTEYGSPFWCMTFQPCVCTYERRHISWVETKEYYNEIKNVHFIIKIKIEHRWQHRTFICSNKIYYMY